MVNVNWHLRGQDFFNPAKHNTLPITIIGCGGVGSNVVYGLAKMGINNITIYDADVVEEHNIGGQFFSCNDIGKPKVIAMENLLQNLLAVKINTVNKFWTPEDYISGVIIAAVDKMAVRREIFEYCRLNAITPLLIDVRVGGEVVKIYTTNTINKDCLKFYEASLHDDSNSVELSCTGQWIYDIAMWLSGIVVNVVRYYLTTKTIRYKLVMLDGKNLVQHLI